MSNKPKDKFLHHIGKKCPKGTEEVAGSIHLGKGTWLLKCKIKEEKSNEK